MVEEIADVNAMFDLTRGGETISPVERLLNEFESHEAKEEKSIEYYKKVVGDLPSPVTRFLLQLVISDEEKHRAVIHSMVATLKGSLNWSQPAGSLGASADRSVLDGKLIEATDEFIRIEEEGIKDYKILAKQSSEYYHGLFKILLDAMMRDSEKHIELLKFIKETLKKA